MNDSASATRSEKASLVLRRTFEAPCDLLFEVWSQPKHLVNWWGPNDFSLPYCDVDFRIGGTYRFCMRSPEGEDHWVAGVYREIVAPSKIAFTWIREDASGKALCNTVVTVEFEEVEGKTNFILTHDGFESLPYRDEHIGGWSQCLDRLGEYVTVPDQPLRVIQ
jgi:uncharacterized protein YndB with AHSA1/START domain